MMVCIKCGEFCDKEDSDKFYSYCCLCLPVRWITKPVGEWICYKCALRKSAKRNEHNLTEEGELLNLFERSIPKIIWVEGKGTRYPVVGEKKKIKFQLSAKKIGDLDELGETLTEKMKNFYGSVFEITKNGFKSIIYDSEVGGRFYLIGYKDNGNIIFEIDPTIDTSPISIQNLYNYLKENYDSNIVVLERGEV